MLTTQLRSQFVTKIITSQAGEQFKVVFLVALVNGKIKAQVVSSELISSNPISEVSTLYLPSYAPKQIVSFTYTPTSQPTVSLFNSLFFFNSQPTRAPSLAI